MYTTFINKSQRYAATGFEPSTFYWEKHLFKYIKYTIETFEKDLNFTNENVNYIQDELSKFWTCFFFVLKRYRKRYLKRYRKRHLNVNINVTFRNYMNK